MKMTGKKAIIYGHADGDGYLAAEQSRRNVEKDGIHVINVIVDPAKTRNWRFWERSFQSDNFGEAETVLVVDIMLNPKNPLASLEAISNRASAEAARQFKIITHHPFDETVHLPKNLNIRFVDQVYRCCYGPPSELMVIASICDNDEGPVEDLIRDKHRLRALGMKRAVAARSAITADAILYLLQENLWEGLEALAEEPADIHRTYFGNRIKQSTSSPLLQFAYANLACS